MEEPEKAFIFASIKTFMEERKKEEQKLKRKK